MQLGSGTFDLLPCIIYNGTGRDWNWGAQTQATIRTGKNYNHYRLGNRLKLATWLSRAWLNWLSTSLRIEGQWWGNIHGADPDLTPMIVPTANPNQRGGKRLDLLFSMELYSSKGKLKGQHLDIEVGTPLYQSLDGPQLELDWQVSAGWQWTF